MDQKILPEIFRYNLGGMEFPGLHIFLGMTGSGKSSLLKWVLYQYAKKKQWHKIFIFCPTGRLHKQGEPHVKNYDDHFDKSHIYIDHDRYEEQFDQIIEYQKKNEGRRILLVFDDCVGNINFSKKFFTKVATQGRHYNMSTFIVTQYFKAIEPIIRTNAFTFYVFKTMAENIEELASFNADYKSKRDFKDKVSSWINQKYNCCRINITSKMDKGISFFKTIPMDLDFRIEQEPEEKKQK